MPPRFPCRSRRPAAPLLVAAAVVLVCGSCRAPGSGTATTGDATVPGRPAGSLPSELTPGPTALAAPSPGSPGGGAGAPRRAPASGGSTAGTAGGGTTSTTSAGRPDAFAPVARRDDPTGDAGVEAPAHADLVAVQADATATRLRLTVDVAGHLPQPPAPGEVQGVGVDIYLTGRRESDYQLFAQGNRDGWFGYLTDAAGTTSALPGSLLVGGTRVVFEVDWQAVGGARRGELRAFVDWSRERIGVNAAGGDATDRVAFRR